MSKMQNASIKLPEDLAERLKQEAKEQQRSFSGQIVHYLLKGISAPK